MLLIFRELIRTDIYVPKETFNEKLHAKRNKGETQKEHFTIPLKTFWRPVEMQEYYEHDLDNKKYFKKINMMANLTKANFGEYLAPPLRATNQKDPVA